MNATRRTPIRINVGTLRDRSNHDIIPLRTLPWTFTDFTHLPAYLLPILRFTGARRLCCGMPELGSPAPHAPALIVTGAFARQKLRTLLLCPRHANISFLRRIARHKKSNSSYGGRHTYSGRLHLTRLPSFSRHSCSDEPTIAATGSGIQHQHLAQTSTNCASILRARVRVARGHCAKTSADNGGG